MRTFGLADWLVDGYRNSYLATMAESWSQQRALTRRVLLLCVPVLLAYVLVVGSLGWSAYHDSIDLRTLAIMLPMLPSTMNVGSDRAARHGLAHRGAAFARGAARLGAGRRGDDPL